MTVILSLDSPEQEGKARHRRDAQKLGHSTFFLLPCSHHIRSFPSRGSGLGAVPRDSCRLGSALGAWAAPGSAVPRPPRPVPGSYKRRPGLGVRSVELWAVRSMAWNTNLRWRLPITCLVLQVIMVVLFGVFVRYEVQADTSWWLEKKRKNISSDLENEFYYRYPSKSYGPQAHLEESPGGPQLPGLPACLPALRICPASGWRGTGISQSLEK